MQIQLRMHATLFGDGQSDTGRLRIRVRVSEEAAAGTSRQLRGRELGFLGSRYVVRCLDSTAESTHLRDR